jgi:hypothetical protein
MTVAPTPDRLQYLLAGQAAPTWNGIDYVEVASADQTQLRVHFLTTAPVSGTLAAANPVTICGGETIGSVAVLAIDEAHDWSADDEGRPVLRLAVAAPGDFSTYTLTILSSALDPYFDAVAFSFKANCPSDLDCATPAPACPGPEGEPVPIGYLAKDFASFRRALSDFSALRYPAWVERSEADVGVMLMEVLSAIADELSYLQDRVAAEATLATATQRVSLVRHARLVDYEPAPAIAATTTLQLDVAAGVTSIAPGLRCAASGADGRPIAFEVGGRLADESGALTQTTYAVDPRWNAGPVDAPNLLPYWWDRSRACLRAGATRLWIVGHGLGLVPGQRLLIDTAGPTSADAPVREIVTIAPPEQAPDPVSETTDPVFAVDLTRIALQAPTTCDHDLERTHLAGNLVPAVQGARVSETFAIADPTAPPAAAARLVAVRNAANWTPEDPRPDYRFTLDADELSWLPVVSQDADTSASVAAAPELVLGTETATGAAQPWLWQRWLLGSGPADRVFTLTPERFSAIGASADETWLDYDGEGITIRFGDGTFGLVPPAGTAFTVTYLAGGGAIGNVPADTIVEVDPGQPQAASVLSVSNPIAATGGADAETAQQVRDRAPQAFAARPLRVVRPADYVAAAQSLPWVQQAGATFRWTGSWLTAFTTADPAEREDLTVAEIEQLSDLLDRRRLAGYESYVLAPRYASVDLRIALCAQPSAFAADVERAVLTQLRPGALADGGRGFFDHARWAFGAPLEASALLAAVQRAPGVQGVTAVSYRRRGVQPDWAPLPETIALGADEILRVDDDPSRPESGSLSITVRGGK